MAAPEQGVALMRRLLTAYLAEHGPLALLAEALAMAAVFGAIGLAFAVMP